MVDATRALLLARTCHEFGPKEARDKLRLLGDLSGTARVPTAEVPVLLDAVCFLRAYPDDAAVARRAKEVGESLRSRLSPRQASSERLANMGVPGSFQRYEYSYGVVRRMVRAFPGCLEVDWEHIDDEGPVVDALSLLVTPGESQGLEDIRVPLSEWLSRARAGPSRTDLETVLDVFERSGLPLLVRAQLFEACTLPIRYGLSVPGTGRCEVTLPVRRVHHQRKPIDRTRWPLGPRIREPLALGEPEDPDTGEHLIARSLAALCARNLEIYPLIYANARDVRQIDCGLGLSVLMVGTEPECRSTLECLYFFLVAKNGIPIAYGPAGVFEGCCEMGINLFPEYRGGEIRLIYAQLMRVLHHMLGAEYYFLTEYGMGVGSLEALRSGAFWFYRKLGFLPTSARVERIAREEESRMRADPRHRSDAATLRRLSNTRAYLDLSGGRCVPMDFGGLGLAQARLIALDYGADRPAAVEASVRRVRSRLGEAGRRGLSSDERRAFWTLAPLVAMIPDLDQWSGAEHAALARFMRAKGAVSEAAAARMRQPRLVTALERIAARARSEG